MGEITKLTRATTGKESLRTTVPMSILKQFKLEAGDKFDWNFEARNNELIIVVRPLKSSNGKVGIHKEEVNKEESRERNPLRRR